MSFSLPMICQVCEASFYFNTSEQDELKMKYCEVCRGNVHYETKYYNKALKGEGTLQARTLDQALKNTKTIASFPEMDDVKLYEVKRIYWEGK